MSDICLQLVATHFPELPKPFPRAHGQYVLMELSSCESGGHAAAMLEQAVGVALDRGIARDAVVAASGAQSRGLWQLREHISMAQAKAGKNIKHDISLPISRIVRFIATTDAKLREAFPGCVLVTFGHLGDGNLHYNVAPPEGVAARRIPRTPGRGQPHRARPGRRLRRLDLGRTRHRRAETRRTQPIQVAGRTRHDACDQSRARPPRHHEPWQNPLNEGAVMVRTLVVAASLAACAAASAQTVYKCSSGGKVSYGEQPCSAGAQATIAVPPRPGPIPN